MDRQKKNNAILKLLNRQNRKKDYTKVKKDKWACIGFYDLDKELDKVR